MRRLNVDERIFTYLDTLYSLRDTIFVLLLCRNEGFEGRQNVLRLGNTNFGLATGDTIQGSLHAYHGDAPASHPASESGATTSSETTIDDRVAPRCRSPCFLQLSYARDGSKRSFLESLLCTSPWRDLYMDRCQCTARFLQDRGAWLLTSIPPALQSKAHTRHFSQVAGVAGPVARASRQSSVEREWLLRELLETLASILMAMSHLLDARLDRSLHLCFSCCDAFPGHALVRRSQIA
jgi:hypothetical protein